VIFSNDTRANLEAFDAMYILEAFVVHNSSTVSLDWFLQVNAEILFES
jgi:hypothetical protein